MINQRCIDAEQANFHKLNGNYSFSLGNYDQALVHFNNAISCNSLDATLYTNRSTCYYNMRMYHESLTDAKKSIELDPKWFKGYWRKAAAEFCLRDYKECEKTLTQGLEIEPNSEMSEKLLEYMKVIECLPQEIDILNQMLHKAASADCDVPSHLYEPALQKELLKLPFSPDLLIPILNSDSRIKDALRRFKEYAAVLLKEEEEKKDENYQQMTKEKLQAAFEEAKTAGNDAYRKKKFQEALSYYNKAHEMDPDQYLILNNKAAVYLELKNYKRALEEVEAALQIYQKQPPNLILLAKLYHRKGNIYSGMQDYDQAIEFYKKSIMEDANSAAKIDLPKVESLKKKEEEKKLVNPDIAEHHKEKANELFEKGYTAEALKEYEEALRRNPEDASLYYQKASCHYKFFDLPGSLAAITKALDIDPLNVNSWLLKGQIHEWLQEYKKAYDAYAEGCKYDPENEKCRQKLEAMLVRNPK